MDKDIVSEIIEDHKKIKNLYKKGFKEASLSEKKRIFDELAPIVIAHAKSEEGVIYAQTCNYHQTKKDAFEGFEEHALVDLLIDELKSEKNTDKWEAKFTVVCEMLDHHITEEENHYLPKLAVLFNETQREEMGAEYRETFLRLIKAQRNISEPDYPNHLRSH